VLLYSVFICLFVVLLYSVFHLFVCSAPVFGISFVCLLCSSIRCFICLFVVLLCSVFHLFVCSAAEAQQTNKWNTEYRRTTNKQMKYRRQKHYKQTNETQNTGALKTNKWKTEYRSTINKQMKYRIQELYKQTNEIPNIGALQTNRWNIEHRSTTNKQMKHRIHSCIRCFICLFVVFLCSVFHLFVCSAPVFGVSSVCL
jgi:hypothetical protein